MFVSNAGISYNVYYTIVTENNMLLTVMAATKLTNFFIFQSLIQELEALI